MAGQLSTYQEEIFNFLRTVTVKFTPFASMMGKNYMVSNQINDPNGKWNPYYINLSGEYSETDTRMTVYSVESGRQVPFDRDLFTQYPKTAAIYKVGTQEYANLEEQYPENRGLIKNIVYPVDIDYALNAEELSLLNYDASFLEENERESIVTRLKEFLDVVRNRWWIPEYQYENMYAITFWAMMWQMIPAVLLSQRFMNIRTPNVHSFHIWEYLKSRGVGDYRDVLTSKQSLWLYRNIDYIQANLGKHGNLDKLASNLLGEAALSLQAKDMYTTLSTKWHDQLLTTPKFVSTTINTDNVVLEEDFNTLNRKLTSQNLDNKDTSDKALAAEDELGAIAYSRLPTKFLELKKDEVNTSRLPTMVKFFLDTLFTAIQNDKFLFTVQVVDSMSGSVAKVDIEDAVLLWYYALQRSVDVTPEVIPYMYNFNYAWQMRAKPDLASFDSEDIVIEEINYPISEKLDIPVMLAAIPWSTSAFASPEQWMQYVLEAYTAYSDIDRRVKLSSNQVYHFAMEKFYNLTRAPKGTRLVELSKHTTYQEWLEANHTLAGWISNIEGSADKTKLFQELAVNCYNSLFDTSLIQSDLIVTPTDMETIYAAIRDLFISLGSYNVTYLETVRGVGDYIEIYDNDFIMGHHENLNWGVPGTDEPEDPDHPEHPTEILASANNILVSDVINDAITHLHNCMLGPNRVVDVTSDIDISNEFWPIEVDQYVDFNTFTQKNIDDLTVVVDVTTTKDQSVRRETTCVGFTIDLDFH